MVQYSNSIENIIQILELKVYKVKKDEIWTLCLNPEHPDKHIGNFSINLNSGEFNCFACGFHGNIIYLLSNKGIKYGHAIVIWNQVRRAKTNELNFPKEIDKYVVQSYVNNGLSEYALKRIGDKDVLLEYNVYSDKFDNPVFLTKNRWGNFDSIWVRENDKYWLLEPFEAKSTGILFGVHLPSTAKNILTEGPFDAMMVRKVTGLRGLAGFGTHLSTAQYNLLEQVNNLVLMMDGDYAGRKAREYIYKRLANKGDLFLAGHYRGDPDELEPYLSEIIETAIPGYLFRLGQIK